MASSPAPDDGQAQSPTAGDATRSRGVTIGAVCQTLRQEFPDISISKIRYLEDQRLITPERTAGGYRLYSQGDIDRLRAILRMQRDEFLPLRIIRQELAAGRGRAARPRVRRPRRRAAPIASPIHRRLRPVRPTSRYWPAARSTGRTTCWPRPAPRSVCSRSSPTSGSSPATPARRQHAVRRRRARDRRGGRRLAAMASARATCARSGRPPIARPGCCSSCSARAAVAQPRAPQGGDRRARRPRGHGLPLSHLLLVRDLRRITD